jgi:putative membrane protein
MNGPAGTRPDTGPDTTTMKVDDKKFVKDAALGGMAEVELGKLATQKASSEDVKQFGQKMVDDHTKANDQLKEVASKENITIPDSLDSKHQSRIDKLSKLSGPDFDKAYVKDQVKDHEKDVSEFKSEADNGSDPNIKQFASSTLPTLQEHLNIAKGLNKKEKKVSAK